MNFCFIKCLCFFIENFNDYYDFYIEWERVEEIGSGWGLNEEINDYVVKKLGRENCYERCDIGFIVDGL